jgi:hypothetical protein
MNVEKYLLCVLCGQVGNDFVVCDVDGSIVVVIWWPVER